MDERTPSDWATPRLVLTLAIWACLAGVTLVLGLQVVDNPSIRVAIIQSFTPWMPAAALAAVVVAWIVRADVAGAAGAVLVLVSLALITPVAWADDLPAPADGASPFTVASANVLFSNDRIAEVGDLLSDVDADVIALIEITPLALEELELHPIAADYPHRIDRPGWAASGMALWSRFPLVEIPEGEFGPRFIEADIAVPDGTVRVVAAHPPPPVSSRELWLEETALIPAIADGFERIVVMGDFNASFFHPPFRRAVSEADLVSAAAATGEGLTMTWPAHGLIPAFVTIDHILFGDAITALDSDVVGVPGSDHHAVVAELAIAG